MAHPHSEHKAHHHSRKRAHHLMKDGGHAKHPDAKEDKALIHKMISKHAHQEHGVHGLKRGGRLDKYARGGSAKKGKHHTQVNIAIVNPHGKDGGGPAGPMAAPGGAPPMPPKPPMPPGGGMPPPGGMPPGMPPGGPPPGMMKPPMKRGGTVRPVKMKAGYEAGALSGEGRLEKIKKYGHKAKG